MHEVLSYQCMRPEATSVEGRKLPVYGALSYSAAATGALVSQLNVSAHLRKYGKHVLKEAVAVQAHS